MNYYNRLSNIVKNLRERYPIGTRITFLGRGDDSDPIPSGTRGTVEGIDDTATVFCRFDDGRNLGLAYGKANYRALTPYELFEEKCEMNYCKYLEEVYRDIFADIDLSRFAEEIDKGDDTYITEILKQLHNKFVDIYDTDYLDNLVGSVSVPSIVESENTGKYYPALIMLDIDSSGEHGGACVLSPIGVIEQSNMGKSEDEIKFMKSLSPYKYWYTVKYYNDIHVDMADCPEHICNIISNAIGESLDQNGGMSL